jgi:SulP family sulfate permease
MVKKYIQDLKTEFSGYNGKTLARDAMAGLTVAAVALPLALAFGVSSGADAASGLITAIFAGLITGVLSGASYQISGPTGAMSAILLTLSAKYGMTGVMTAGFLSGIILIIASVLKAGKLVSYIPTSVITGFTSGIAIVIALGQIDNFFGTTSQGSDAIEKLLSYGQLGFSPNLWAVIFGLAVVVIMIVYPKKWNAVIPSSLASLIIVLIVNLIINPNGTLVAEVGDIPRKLVTDFGLIKTGFDFSQVSELVVPAFSIAVLGMIESLLCGASAGKMKNERIDAQRELIAQGVGNIIIPMLGGVPSTAAIARTSVAIKSGGQTRMVSVFHSITLILSMFLLGGVMSRIPMSALAGVLMVTAWRMNEWESIKNIFRRKVKSAIAMFIVTMLATVIFDLTIAIVAGVVLAMLLFIIKSSYLTVTVSDVDDRRLAGEGLNGDHSGIKVVYLSGPLFFGTQDVITEAISKESDFNAMIFSMRGVPSADDASIDELLTIYNEYKEKNIDIIFCGVQPSVKEMMKRIGFIDAVGRDHVLWDVIGALRWLEMKNAQAVEYEI